MFHCFGRENQVFVNIEKESIQFPLKLTIMEESTLNVVRLLNKTRYNTCEKTSIHRLLGRLFYLYNYTLHTIVACFFMMQSN